MFFEAKHQNTRKVVHLAVFLAPPLYLSILSGAWLKRPGSLIFLPLFSFPASIGKLFWRERDTAAQHWKLKSCLLRNASDIRAAPQNLISEPTNPDFWGNKSWRLREKSGLMLMQEVGAPVRAYLSRWSMEDDTMPFPKDPNTPAIMSAIFILQFWAKFSSLQFLLKIFKFDRYLNVWLEKHKWEGFSSKRQLSRNGSRAPVHTNRLIFLWNLCRPANK